MRTLIVLLLSTLACAAQLTLQRAHYPTIFKSAAASTPPVTGFSMWITPDSPAWTNEVGTVAATSGEFIRKLEDMSGNGNHLYFNTTIVPNGAFPPKFDSSYTLGGNRIIQFGQACGTASPNKTGLISSNNITMIGGMTMFAVSSFLDAPCTGGSQEIAGSIFTFGSLEFLFRRYNAASPNRIWTFHNPGAILLDPVEVGNSNYQFYAFTFNDAANTTDLWRSNNVVATGADTGATPGANKVELGWAPFDAINSHVNAGLVEFILYTNALTTLQISNVNVYLKNKYSL